MAEKLYEPLEDSFLLKKHIKKYVKGTVLDIGTGTGIQALEAAKSKRVVKVFATDINPKAIDYCREHVTNKKIIFLTSDLFNAFRFDKRYKDIKFDTIIFNPPYLPTDKKAKDIALDGGKNGYELICRFLNNAKPFLKPKTNILIIFSSLTGKEKIDHYLTKKHFTFKELEKKHIFFEDLFVYNSVLRIPMPLGLG